MRSQESLTHKMKKAIYPGSFDPMTLGHLDIIERSSRIVDELNVAVLKNNAKNPLFSADERVSMIKEFTSHLPNVTVTAYDGLLADYADQIGANIIVRGLRAVTDFEYRLHRPIMPSIPRLILFFLPQVFSTHI